MNYKFASLFLNQNNYHDFTIEKIAGDASFRSYYRVACKQKSYILMFAPPSYEDVNTFMKVDNLLRQNSFLAPEILAIDKKSGFLLLQDFGDISYGKFLIENKNSEIELYKMACDELIKLHKLDYDQYSSLLPKYNNAVYLREVWLFIDWYLLLSNKKINLQQKQQFKNLWFEQFDQLSKESRFLVLRDYHADNLMLINDSYQRKVGLLDFQDALIGSRAYDLVSLLEDARRDVSNATVNEVINYYISKSKINHQAWFKDYEILSLQRNIKILGIFARLAIRDNKKRYLDLMPRVLAHVKNRLNSNTHDFLAIKIFLNNLL